MGSQEGPGKIPKAGPKGAHLAQGELKRPQSGRQVVQMEPPEEPRCTQETLKMSQKAAKRTPETAKEASKSARVIRPWKAPLGRPSYFKASKKPPRLPKRVPRGAQEIPYWAQLAVS